MEANAEEEEEDKAEGDADTETKLNNCYCGTTAPGRECCTFERGKEECYAQHGCGALCW